MLLRSFFIVFVVAGALACRPANSQDRFRVYLGTYTGKESKGIYQCELNLKDGSLSSATLAGDRKSVV